MDTEDPAVVRHNKFAEAIKKSLATWESMSEYERQLHLMAEDCPDYVTLDELREVARKKFEQKVHEVALKMIEDAYSRLGYYVKASIKYDKVEIQVIYGILKRVTTEEIESCIRVER